MSISWDQWEAMRASLDYSWQRMLQLAESGKPENQLEYEALIQHAMGTANRLLALSGPYTPALSTAKLRLRWQAGRNEAMSIRERIVEQQARGANLQARGANLPQIAEEAAISVGDEES